MTKAGAELRKALPPPWALCHKASSGKLFLGKEQEHGEGFPLVPACRKWWMPRLSNTRKTLESKSQTKHKVSAEVKNCLDVLIKWWHREGKRPDLKDTPVEVIQTNTWGRQTTEELWQYPVWDGSSCWRRKNVAEETFEKNNGCKFPKGNES